jgi:hypothetical protein
MFLVGQFPAACGVDVFFGAPGGRWDEIGRIYTLRPRTLDIRSHGKEHIAEGIPSVTLIIFPAR